MKGKSIEIILKTQIQSTDIFVNVDSTENDGTYDIEYYGSNGDIDYTLNTKILNCTLSNQYEKLKFSVNNGEKLTLTIPLEYED